MKKFAFTAISLLILGAACTLYLEQSNKRFLESLPKAPSTDEQPLNTTNAPVTEDEDITPLKSVPSETIVKHAASESEHAYPYTLDQTEAAVNFEDPSPEPSTDATLEPSSENHLQEDIHILEEFEKQLTATETLTNIVYDSNNWVKGEPGEVGFGFVLSREDAEAFFGANALLNPTQANRQALEFLRNPPPPPSENTGQETEEFIEYNGGKLYAPIWFWTAD